MSKSDKWSRREPTMIKFVQIGTSNANDECYRVVKDKDIELGVLVEPMPEMADLAEECYEGIENIHMERIAIVDDEGFKKYSDGYIPIYYYWPNTAFNSVFPAHTKSFNRDGSLGEVHSFLAPIMTMNQLFEKYSIKELDYLFVDVEGLDGDVIKSIDFDKYKINEIVYERIHLHRGKVKEVDLRNHLQDYGYRLGGDNMNTRAILK